MGSRDDGAWAVAMRDRKAANKDVETILSKSGAATIYDLFTPETSETVDAAIIARTADLDCVPDTLSALLRALRVEAALTLDQVASSVGVAKPSVWAWENGRCMPGRDKWNALAKALGVAPKVLVAAAKAQTKKKAAPTAMRIEEEDRAERLAACRETIAKCFDVPPSAVRITIEI